LIFFKANLISQDQIVILRIALIIAVEMATVWMENVNAKKVFQEYLAKNKAAPISTLNDKDLVVLKTDSVIMVCAFANQVSAGKIVVLLNVLDIRIY
jgi:hypothetical protein